jgi:hypothetical protein
MLKIGTSASFAATEPQMLAAAIDARRSFFFMVQLSKFAEI